MKFVLFMLACLLLFTSSCSLRESGYASPSFQVATINSVLVLPRTGSRFDAQIAGRVREHLDTAGIGTADLSRLRPLAQITATDACRQASELDYQVVVFADWNSLVMVECKTLLTAFSRVGNDMNARGIDVYTRELINYLKGSAK